jgi:hypothetical protein
MKFAESVKKSEPFTGMAKWEKIRVYNNTSKE